MNPVLILTHNNLELTKKCVESVLAQNIPVDVCIFDNGSTDETPVWIATSGIRGLYLSQNDGVSRGWNVGLRLLFEKADHVFVLNNDTIIPSWFCSSLLAYDLPFITGRETTNLPDLEHPVTGELGGGPQFSAFLIRRDAWEKIGQFDESMWGWCSDCDYHVRAHRLGITLQSAPVLYYHERSSTILRSEPKEKRILQMQADVDRLAFHKKWGHPVSGPGYDSEFTPENFGIDAQ